MALVLGCIADDFTGATDLANNLVRSGLRAVQTIGVPAGPLDSAADAVVVALKSRTIAAEDAVRQSLDALRWLRAQGAQQIYFKYCSTFDSTPLGNIGPVAEALMDALATDFTIATPAFPDAGRTVFHGHLFVNGVPLAESGMKDHPLTPMRDSNLVRVLQTQCRRRVGLIDHRTTADSAQAIAARIEALRTDGVALAVVDVVTNDDLLRIGAAVHALPLVTAGSGLALGLPPNWGFAANDRAVQLPGATGRRAVLAGSCSAATQRQVGRFLASGHPGLALDPLELAEHPDTVAQALAWAAPRLDAGPVLIYSTAPAEHVQAAQRELGTAEAGALVERTLAAVARGLVERGVGQLIVAGGETSGACVNALDIAQLRIGPQIDPGVPWCFAACPAAPAGALHIALKSGNFGADDFFLKAFERL